jgi:nucleotide-binding universal stress UspA family protein
LRQTTLPLLIAVQVPSAPYAHTLLGLDFDEASRVAARAAWDLGVFEHTTVAVAHVVQAPARGMMERGMATSRAVDAYVASEARDSAIRLQSFLADLDLPLSHHHLITDQTSIALALVSCANKDGANLIVMGTNQRKGFERTLVGSVAADVLSEAQRDILVVPVSCAVEPTLGSVDQ